MTLQIQIILIISSILILVGLMTFTNRIIKKVALVKSLDPNRKVVVLNTFYFLYYILFFVSIVIILGINIERLFLFLSSIIAVIGIAFFAQWSILSNITSSVVLFFYHPIKIGHKVKILDKELDFTGEIKNITAFYVLIETDEGIKITIPNSLVLQKGIEFVKEN